MGNFQVKKLQKVFYVFTYQVRERKFVTAKGQNFVFPNTIELIFSFLPLQPFGGKPTTGRTIFMPGKSKIRFGGPTARYSVKLAKPIKPLKFSFEETGRRIEIQGNKLHIHEKSDSQKLLDERVEKLFFAIPILLSTEFADPPYVEKVYGKVGKVPFEWVMASYKPYLRLTKIEDQQNSILTSWKRLNVLDIPQNSRIVASLHYFHVACRLKAAGDSPWEFMAEVILNLCKVLEALFPPTGEGKSMDSAREGLENLGYSETEIERDFIPAIALRNNIDSAHVDLSVFPREQLKVIINYTDTAEDTFQKMLQRLIAKTQEGQYSPAPYGEPKIRQLAEKVIEKMAKFINNS